MIDSGLTSVPNKREATDAISVRCSWYDPPLAIVADVPTQSMLGA